MQREFREAKPISLRGLRDLLFKILFPFLDAGIWRGKYSSAGIMAFCVTPRILSYALLEGRRSISEVDENEA